MEHGKLQKEKILDEVHSLFFCFFNVERVSTTFVLNNNNDTLAS